MIEVKLGHRKQWITLVEFTLRAAHIIEPDVYITYSNSPHDLTKEDMANASAKLATVMKRARAASQSSEQAR